MPGNLSDDEARKLADALLSSASEMVQQGKAKTVEEAVVNMFSDLFSKKEIEEKVDHELDVNNPESPGVVEILSQVRPRKEG